VLESLKRLFRREADPERQREVAENSLRAQQELRQAEKRNSEDQRATEGIQSGFRFGRP